MIVLLPVAKFSVNYDVAQGIPYSKLDKLILESIYGGATSIEALEDTFFVHRRLIIQSLVSLIHTGWVALGSSKQDFFVLTEEGKKAVENNAYPPLIEIRQISTSLLVERITGMVIQENEVIYYSRYSIESKGFLGDCFVMKPLLYETKLDAHEVIFFLPKVANQRIHSINRTTLSTRDQLYIPVYVKDSSNFALGNLPQRCKNLLGPHIFKAIQNKDFFSKNPTNSEQFSNELENLRKRRTAELSGKQEGLSTTTWESRIYKSDIICGYQAHRNVLIQAIEKAQTSVLIVSPSISIDYLEENIAFIKTNLNRGIDIDILCNGINQKTIDWYSHFCLENDSPGKIHLNRDPSKTNGSVLIWDDQENHYCSVIGSFEWLYPQNGLTETTNDKLTLSVKLVDPLAVSSIARCIADYWKLTPSGLSSSESRKWETIARKIIENSIALDLAAGITVSIEMVNHRQHGVVLQNMVCSSHGKMDIISKGGNIDDQTVIGLLRDNDVNVNIFMSTAVEERIGRFENTIREKIHLRKSGGTNLFISGNSVYIGSYDLLSSIVPTGQFPKELGVHIEGDDFVQLIKECIKE